MTKRCSQVIAETHAAIERELHRIRRDREGGRPLDVLDVGCWDGATTERYRQILGGSARGVEIFPEQIAAARAKSVDVAPVDLESSRLPWPDASVDIAVANQVFEHLKNVWLAISEIARLIRPGGYLVFSVPNLGSLHNRLMLAFGYQPSAIRTFGPHIRGFTYRQVRSFLEYGHFFQIVRVTGVGFYPLPARWAGVVARTWVGGSHTPVLVLRRQAPVGTQPPWSAMMAGADIGEQTFYTVGN